MEETGPHKDGIHPFMFGKSVSLNLLVNRKKESKNRAGQYKHSLPDMSILTKHLVKLLLIYLPAQLQLPFCVSSTDILQGKFYSQY